MSQRIGVIFGGTSTEHSISCLSAKNIAQGLLDAGYEIALVGITMEGDWLPFQLSLEVLESSDWERQTRASLADAPGWSFAASAWSPRAMVTQLFGGPVDVIWPAVHGINCEDGVLQGFLELTGLPYVGAGVLGSAMGMDKIVTKKQCEYHGIPVTPWMGISRLMIHDAQEAVAEGERPALLDQVQEKLGYPCFLKPANGGSSVGTYVAKREEELLKQLEACAAYDTMVLAESFVDAREIEVAVQGNETLVVSQVGEIVKSGDIEYYDYDAKYLSDDDSSLQIPAELDEADASRISEYAAEVYRILGCSGMARVDFFKDQRSGAIYLNEINTLPGFTRISLYPVAMSDALGSLSRVMTRMVDLALERHVEKMRQNNYVKED